MGLLTLLEHLRPTVLDLFSHLNFLDFYNKKVLQHKNWLFCQRASKKVKELESIVKSFEGYNNEERSFITIML